MRLFLLAACASSALDRHDGFRFYEIGFRCCADMG